MIGARVYSQGNIERVLDQLFPSPGVFLEIGAWDGEHFSQTAHLERDKGWIGVCVDPFPVNFKGRTCWLCERAISRDGQPRAFIRVSIDRRYGGNVSYLSGFKQAVQQSIHWPVIEQFCNYEEIQVETITFAQLAGEYKLPSYIDFLSVDVEGSEVEIFETIDFNAHRFGLIMFEHNFDEQLRNRVDKILTANGYVLHEELEFDDLYTFSHKQWLENEYRKWIDALQASTVHNFKDHTMVKRMLGEIQWPLPIPQDIDLELLTRIDNIGRSRPSGISGTAARMIHYAQKVLERNPRFIVEIGGGVGQFYATLCALGYTGRYFIFDLEGVKAFQDSYLSEVERQTGVLLPRFQNPQAYEFCVSFYALGEFDDATKAWYVEHVVRKCPHGFVIWNPHSGASDMIDFPCRVTDESPLLHPGNKQLEW